MQARAGMMMLAAATFDMKFVRTQEERLAVTVRARRVEGPWVRTMVVSQPDRPDS